MKKLTTALGLFALLALSPHAEAAKAPELTYYVNLNDRADDRFKVRLEVKGLKNENNVFQFAATAPGTYQTMDIGRFVHDFKAYDKKGRELEVKQISTNQWQLSQPKKVRKITYQIAETWDTPVEENRVYAMCGTSLEPDHALINGQGVFGYIQGLQAQPFRIQLAYPQEWLVGTALSKDAKGYYTANNYDHAVDSPILAGTLTKAATDYNGTTIDIYTYSKTGKIQSEDLLQNMTSMLEAANKFVVDFPVDRYTFLYHFEDESWGAWEHSYSSEYVMKEQDLTPAYAQHVTDIAAHEFFHVITPLNIHSEVIEQFNFVKPTPSQHLWLYEGTTEWASDMMQLRGGLMDLPAYLKDLSRKLAYDDQMDKNYSLLKLALTSYTPEGQKQYGNIYNRGALTAALLDIRLLELSGGKRGLREVVNELSKEYGPSKAFPEKDFFEIFTAKTYPEIGDFFNRYIKNAEPLPVAEYYSKLGIQYTAAKSTGNKIKGLGYGLSVPDGRLRIAKVEAEMQEAGLRDMDALLALNGTTLTLQNATQVLGQLHNLQPGDRYTLTIERDGKKQEVICKVQEKEEVLKHLFELDQQATPQQVALRNSWMKNM
ncbi:putative metalloprotease with PDZ domain [Pontibacter ummariensis]|uniref:Predicted metalloprotease, contains C-terminal PDZ domain n=1 Tax=Pontibacter ummariensis TaxID=1610492 RepID=A0A239KJ20_9BACT|nr:PDZ domain-containing protein [Pontibacter ummariensis]PRY05699.1 putative metalloprotease with PDZ domain [Pontibacter ummariensis]SNT18366.1 Predicted metalloprotease, contains C-terminal PDZ domain [Pontibacter ummariensis]